MENFDRCIRAVLSEEGGLSDHNQDPGGLTKYGISQRSYPDLDIQRLTMDQVIDIYRRDYWNPVHGTDLPASLALLVFDAAVNQGTKTAARLLQKTVGVNEDGVIGPITLSAVLASRLEHVLINFCAERALRYELNRNESVFGRGWYRRLFRMYATALEWHTNAVAFL